MNDEKEASSKFEDIARKYNIDLSMLKKEQEKLAKQISIKDEFDFSRVVKTGGISNIFFKNKIISTVVVIDSEFNIIEQKFFSGRATFPYIPGFRAYRELPAMASCFSQVEEKPEVVFIQGHGISHPRLGIASHFSLACGVPTVGVADSLVAGEVKDDSVLLDGKVVGGVVKTKEGGKPLYVSPGNLISVKSSIMLTKRFTREPHKLPEPLSIAHKYAREVMREMFKA
jgi:deoxyribonuclease V